MPIQASKALWDAPKDWDLRVLCRNGVWLIHQEILKRRAPGFFDFAISMAKVSTVGTENLPWLGEVPGESQAVGMKKDVLTVDLSAWRPFAVGGLLRFLYIGGKSTHPRAPSPFRFEPWTNPVNTDWGDMDGHLPSPTNLRSIPLHVQIAAQAYTLKFPLAVRDAAVAKINIATYQFNNVKETVLRQTMLKGIFIRPEGYVDNIEDPMLRTIEFLYAQEAPGVVKHLLPVRAAIARLQYLVGSWLWEQPDFPGIFEQRWKREPMHTRAHSEFEMFQEIGCMLPRWNDPFECIAKLEAEMEGSASSEEGAHEDALK